MQFDIHTLHQLFLSSKGICTDSRKVQPGQIFFALKGENSDGNIHAANALDAGAARVVVDNPAVVSGDQYILVEDTLFTLQELARYHRQQISASVIGITGSNGKTTTKELILAVLAQKYRVVATQGNLNNHIGVPLTILRATSDTEILIVEMGANHPGEIAFLSQLADPEFGLITSIGEAHLEGFGSREGIRRAKSELYHYIYGRKSGCLIWNADDPVIEGLVKEFPVSELCSYGNAEQADVRGTPDLSGLFMQFCWHAPEGEVAVKTRLVGRYNFPNAMAAVAAGVLFEVPSVGIVQAIASYTPSNSRSQYLDTGKNRLVVDCYNANPSSMRAAVGHFSEGADSTSLLILGDMFELGAYARDEHTRLMRYVKDLGMDAMWIGEVFHALSDQGAGKAFRGVAEAAEWLKNNPLQGRSILLKGSRGVQLERLIPLL
ncbi:MAG TPA: UDP-N-acetylmuramoyl-tripeptide--D-alanyl-D-alanine ligase [Bacteroidales bacterium]|nr:UDP-N-acetylmuramoyl-tripeptide--D-alanyl-D-alanine ligase [Bacteroidales bacterium]HRZ50018.1 UDP-N-acetylmuramoyl-tripeptide--D-alanyl-D-alanine ligase [Bacteroidales bacterium]